MQKATAFFSYWLSYTRQYKSFHSMLVAYKKELVSGKTNGQQPVPPALGAAPAAVDSGIFIRAGSIGKRIKAHYLYTIADGSDLGLEGTVVQAENPNDMKPKIKLKLTEGGHPQVIWKRKNSDGIDIYADKGAGFVFLATDLKPNYTDTSPLPAGAAIWHYRCIYRKNDKQIGMWSDVASITVTGI